jgi:formylmethanofuran dehydrogenase subunit C
MITLTLKETSPIPLEAGTISPDQFLGKGTAEIAKLKASMGNQIGQLGDFFTINGEGGEEIQLEGDLGRVKHIGEGMTQGRILIHSDVGMHLGARMRGGEIRVHGNAGDWVGAEMRGGFIHIHGNAGHGLGGAYRGSPKGMNRGLIVVEGSTRNETGAFMRRGLIVVLGDVGDFAGSFMLAGTLLVFGRVGLRPGAGMKRGTIVAYHPVELLPTYRFDCRYKPSFLRLTLQSLRQRGLDVRDEYMSGYYQRYSGDLTSLGKGEILIYDQH